MAGPRNRRQGDVFLIDKDDVQECPICLEPFSSPIFLCNSGHDICGQCKQKLRICPLCRAPITDSRNGDLEKLIAAALVPCPNNAAGCNYTLQPGNVERHLQVCTFRDYSCPIGTAYGFGNCHWSGKRSEMMDHFKDRHTAHCNITQNVDIELNHVSTTVNNTHLYLTNIDKMLFILQLKIDARERMAYWTVQHIGTKYIAETFNYRIEINSKIEPLRKVMFTEVCTNDTSSLEDVIKQNKCGVVSLDALNQFIKDHKLSFKYNITKQSDMNNKFKKNDDSKDNRNSRPGRAGPRPGGPGPRPRSHSKGPAEPKESGFKGSEQNKGPGFKGPGYKGRKPNQKKGF